MANAEHFRILQQGINAWNLWREEHPEVQPDLSQADRTHAYLRGANLSRVDLSGVRFFGADLRRAGLSGAKLNAADLSGAIGLAQDQVDSANGDASTRLPRDIQRPADWKNKVRTTNDQDGHG